MKKSELIQNLYDIAGDDEVEIRVPTIFDSHPIVAISQRNGLTILHGTTTHTPVHLPPVAKKEVGRLLHRLWGNAIGTPEYNKDDWMALQRLLE